MCPTLDILCEDLALSSVMLGKVEGREVDDQQQWVDMITMVMGAPLEDLKAQVRDRLSWRILYLYDR